MRRQLVVAFIWLTIVATTGTVFAVPGVTGSAKTMSDINKAQQVPTNIDAMKLTLRDQTILLTYIRAIDKSMMILSVDQLNLLTRNYLIHQYTSQTPLETREQMMIAIDKMMIFMTHDQLAAMLDTMISMLTKEQLKSLITDNNNEVTETGVARWKVLCL
jgi:hypothetical protein